jgi:hypothetical protein
MWQRFLQFGAVEEEEVKRAEMGTELELALVDI